MNDQGKTKLQLLEELGDLRRRVAEQEDQIAQCQQAEMDQQQVNDGLPGLLATAGFDGHYKEVNAAFERILGWSKQEMYSRPFIEFVHKDDRVKGLREMARLKAGKTLTDFICRMLCKDGSYRWISWSVIPISDREVVFGVGKDITEQKQAEELLRDSEERYRQLADSTPDVVYILDKTGKLLYANRVAGAYFGVDPESLVGKTQHDLFPPEKASFHLERIRESFETGVMGDMEDSYRFGDREIWLNVRTIPLRNEQGEVTSLMGMCRDITKRKQAEESLRKAHDELEERVKERTSELTAVNQTLREREEKWRRLIEVLPDAVVECTLTGHITYASRQVLQVSGADSVEEVLTKGPLGFFVPEDHLKFFDSVQKTIEEGVTRDVPYECIREDGTRFFGEASAAVIKDETDNPTSIVAIFRDVTERKKAKEALQQNHDELQAIHDGMVEGLIVTDIETRRFLRANESICRMLGYTEAELLSLSIKDIHPAEALPEILENIGLAEDTDHTRPGNIPFLRKDGSVFYAEAIGKSLIYDGRPCSLGIFRDITERLQAEAALEQERQMLWKMLQASDHERQTISYDIHDGLAQYLAAAGMEFQAHDSMRERSPSEAEKAYETAVELVRRAHAEARRLIGEVRHPVIDERGLAIAIVSLAYEQQQCGGPKIECYTSVEFDRLPATLENALYRIVQEALTNARKHSKSKKITVTMVQEGQNVRLEVQDWGIGFNIETIERGRFGLESIRQRARLLGGRLVIESKPGSGTLVQVVVPILENPTEKSHDSPLRSG